MHFTQKDLQSRNKLVQNAKKFSEMTPGEKASRDTLLSLSPPMRQTILIWRKQHKKPAIPGMK